MRSFCQSHKRHVRASMRESRREVVVLQVDN
jgi:hypothetical protein